MNVLRHRRFVWVSLLVALAIMGGFLAHRSVERHRRQVAREVVADLVEGRWEQASQRVRGLHGRGWARALAEELLAQEDWLRQEAGPKGLGALGTVNLALMLDVAELGHPRARDLAFIAIGEAARFQGTTAEGARAPGRQPRVVCPEEQRDRLLRVGQALAASDERAAREAGWCALGLCGQPQAGEMLRQAQDSDAAKSSCAFRLALCALLAYDRYWPTRESLQITLQTQGGRRGLKDAAQLAMGFRNMGTDPVLTPLTTDQFGPVLPRLIWELNGPKGTVMRSWADGFDTYWLLAPGASRRVSPGKGAARCLQAASDMGEASELTLRVGLFAGGGPFDQTAIFSNEVPVAVP